MFCRYKKRFSFVALAILLLLVAVAYPAYAQPTMDWQYNYGGKESDFGRSVQQTVDGGYIVAGYTESFGAGQYDDVYLVKTYPDGTMDWNFTYGGASYDYGRSVQQTSDGGYIVAGDTSSFGAGEYDVYLVKTYPNGTMDWNMTYGGNYTDVGYSVQQTEDGGYIVSGRMYFFGIGDDVYLVKTYPNGTMDWNMTYGGLANEGGYSVQQTVDGGYIVAGYSYSTGDHDVYVVKTFSNGTMDWDMTYDRSNYDVGWSVRQTLDGGYVIAGETQSLVDSDIDVWLMKTYPNGTMQWDQNYGGASDDGGRSVQQTSDGGYIVAGYTESFGAASKDVYVVKTYSNGTMQWNQTYGLGDYNDGYSVQQTVDGGYIVAGETGPAMEMESYITAGETEVIALTSQDFYLVKLAGGLPVGGTLGSVNRVYLLMALIKTFVVDWWPLLLGVTGLITGAYIVLQRRRH